MKGLLVSGDAGQLGAQLIALVIGFIWAWGITWIIFTIAKRYMKIRVAQEVEIEGLDEAEFGQYCYPDFVLQTETNIPYELEGATTGPGAVTRTGVPATEPPEG